MEVSKINGYDLKDKKAIRFYDTVDDMKSDTTLKEGMHVKTKGYHIANDGGGAEYIIKEATTLYNEVLNNELVAELKINDKLNVKQIGIVTDSENTISLSNILAYSKNLYFPEGTYEFSNVEISNLENIKISGDNAVLINSSSFLFDSCSNIEITGLTFNNNTTTPLLFRDCINVNVHDNNFKNNEVSCIRLIRTTGNNSKNYKILNNNFIGVSKTNTWGGAIYVDGQGKLNPEATTETLPIEQIEIRGNLFEEVGTGGVNFGGVKDAIVDSNIFKNSYGAQNMHMTCTRESTNLVITNNTFSGCGWECCILNYCNNAIISNNYFEDCGYGVAIENNCNEVVISNNNIDGKVGNRTHTGEYAQAITYGITLQNSTNLNVKSNNIKNTDEGVFLGANVNYVNIEGNIIHECTNNGCTYGGTSGSNNYINYIDNLIYNSRNGIILGTRGYANLINNDIKVSNIGIRFEQFDENSNVRILNNSINSDIGIDASNNYNINCVLDIINNKIIATTTPLKKYGFNVNMGLITWYNPLTILDETNIASKFVKGSIINYSYENFNTLPTESASAGVGYYMQNVENGVVFIMSNGVWKRKTGGGGATNVTTSDW